jgi:hypothetical protein
MPRPLPVLLEPGVLRSKPELLRPDDELPDVERSLAPERSLEFERSSEPELGRSVDL